MTQLPYDYFAAEEREGRRRQAAKVRAYICALVVSTLLWVGLLLLLIAAL